MKIKLGGLIIYISLALFILGQQITRINYPIPILIKKCLVLSAMFLLTMNLIFVKRKIGYRSFFLFFTVFIILFIDSRPSGFHDLMYWFIIFWCIQKEDLDALYRFTIVFTAFFTLAILLCVYFGILENGFVTHGDRIRYNLGFSSYSILIYQYLSLVFGYIYFRKKISLAEVVIIELIGYSLYKATDLRTAFGLLTVFTFLAYFFQRQRIKNWNRLAFLRWLPLLYCIGSFTAICIYVKGNAFLDIINKALSGRFMWSIVAVERFGIHFLSNNIDWNQINENTYLIVDNSYLNVLLTWGVVGLIFVLLLYTYLIHYALKEKNIIFLLAIITTLTNALLWARLLTFPEVEYVLFAAAIFRKTIKVRKNYEPLNCC